MTGATLLLTVQTTLHCYVVRRDQVHELRLIGSSADLERADERGRPLFSRELGPLLDPGDLRSNARRHALIVPTRRRSVALLVERVEQLEAASLDIVQPLAPLLARRLARPWFLGAVLRDDVPTLVLDLRQIAQDVLIESNKR